MNKPKWAWVCAGLVLVSASAAFSNTKQTQTDKYNKFRLWPERGWEPISPEELKMASLPEAPGAPAVILYREVNRDDRVMAHEANYFRIKILTEEGRKYANVEIPYLRESEDVVDIKARSVQPDGSVVAFDGRATDQTILKAKGVQYLAKTFALPDVQVGSVVEYSYAVVFTEGYLYDSRWVLSEPLFTKQARFTLHSRPGYMLRWSWPLGLPSGNQPPQDDRRGTIRMEANNVPALAVEDYMPPEATLEYRIDFFYSPGGPENDYGHGGLENDAAKFWNEYAKRLSGSIEKHVDKKKAMEQAVQQTVAAEDSPEVKLQKIYARVQHIRNTTFEKEKTEQERKREKEKDATNVEDVWKKGYGDEMQLNCLFLGMVRATGLQAAMVLFSQRNESFFSQKAMNPGELHATAVQVIVDGKERYFDPGTIFTPFGAMPWWKTSSPGLKLGKDGGAWVEAPLPESTATRIERKADLKLDNEGKLQGKLTVTFSGSEAQSLRMEERDEDDTSKKKLLEDMIREMVPVEIDVGLANQPDWKSSSSTMVAEYALRIPGWVSGASRHMLLPVGLFSATEKGVFENAGRVNPIYFHYPYTKADDITIELPLGWKLGSLAKPVDQDVKAASYSIKVEEHNGTLHLTRTLRSDLMMIPKENYPALRAFFQLVRTGDEEQVVLQPSSASAGN